MELALTESMGTALPYMAIDHRLWLLLSSVIPQPILLEMAAKCVAAGARANIISQNDYGSCVCQSCGIKKTSYANYRVLQE